MTREEITRALYALPDKEYVSLINTYNLEKGYKSVLFENTKEIQNIIFSKVPQEVLYELMANATSHKYRKEDKWGMLGGSLKSANSPKDFGTIDDHNLDMDLIIYDYFHEKLSKKLTKWIESICMRLQ